MTLQDDLEIEQERAKRLGQLTLQEKKKLAEKSELGLNRALTSLGNKYGRIIEDIREIEMEIAEEEGRQAPPKMTESEKASLISEFRSKVSSSLEEQREGRVGTLRQMTNASGQSFYSVLETYIKQVSPFNPETNNSISMRQMFTRQFDEISVKNLVDFKDKDLLNRFLEAVDKDKSLGEELDNIIHNIKLLMEGVEAKRGSQEGLSLEGTYSIDVGKFFGAIDLSDSDSRESIYEYWKEIDGKYDVFAKALLKFVDSAKDSKDEDFANRAKKFSDKYSSNTLLGQKGVVGKTLKYVFDIKPIPTERVAPKERLAQVIENIILVENLSDALDSSNSQKVNETFTDGTELDLEEKTIPSGDVLDMVEVEPDEDFENIFDEDVDVLLVIEMLRNKKVISATTDMKTLLRRYLDTVTDILPENKFKPIKTYIERFKNEIENSLILEREDYFIPISVLLTPEFKSVKAPMDITYATADTQINNIAQFFEDFEELIKDWRNQSTFEVAARPDRGSAGSNVDARDDVGSKITPLIGASRPTIAGRRTKLPKYLEDQKELLEDVINAIVTYYANPIYAGRIPVRVPRFATKLGFKDVLIAAQQLEIDTIGREYLRATNESINSLDVEDIRRIRVFFSEVFTKNIKPTTSLISKAKEAILGLTKLFGKAEDNANYISAVLYDIMKQTNTTELAERTIKTKGGRKSILERQQEYEDGRKANRPFPIFGLPLYLDMNEGLFNQHEEPSMASEYNALVNVLEGAGEDMPMLKALLEAHDEIRKALGKEVQYGFMPLSYQAVGNFVSEEGIDLTTFEVENIVKSYDSHKNISVEYGVSTEDVYMIKANFR